MKTKTNHLQIWALCLVAILFSLTAKAEKWPIPNTEPDTLEHFFKDTTLWASGDTIVISSEGEYIVNNTIDILQEVTILGDSSLATRPVIRFLNNGFRAKEDSISIVIKNINFNGYKADSSNSGFILRFRTGNSYWKNIILEDIEAWGLQGGLDLDESKHSIYDSININNVIWHDFFGNQFCIDPNINYAKQLVITNSTFYNIQGGFLKNPDWDGNGDTVLAKNWIIDHNTFYKVGGNNQCLLQVNDPNDETVTLQFTNNIVSKLYQQDNARPFRINPLAGDFNFSYNTFHNYNTTNETKLQYNLDTAILQPNVTASNTFTFDPGFADTTRGFFMLTDTSSLITAASDGSILGDPRWIPNEVTILTLLEKIAVGNETQLDAVVNLSEENKSVSWQVINSYDGTTGEASINSETGLLNPLATGKVKVIATSNALTEFFDTLIVTINERILISEISLSAVNSNNDPADSITNKGGYLILNAMFLPVNAVDKSIEWTYSGTADVLLSAISPSRAKLVALTSGTVTVTATATDGSDVSDEISITISGQSPVENITIASENGETTISSDNGQLQLIATIEPADADNKEIIWTLSDSSIASITTDGLLTAKNNGTVTVSAISVENKYIEGSVDITLSNQISSINNNPENAISVFPNPANDMIVIKSEKSSRILINNLVGATVINTEVNPNGKIDISGLTSGIYIVNIKSGSYAKTVRLIKE